jgi:hypothetical protein
MTIAPSTDDLFVNGPFPHLHRSLSLRRPPDTTVIRRALVVLLLGWVPLMILVVTDTLRTQSSSHSFITDFGVHARSLVAAPLLVLVEVPCLRRLEEIAVYFVHSGLVTEDDYPRFTRLLASTRSLMNSVLAEVVAACLDDDSTKGICRGCLAIIDLIRSSSWAPWRLFSFEWFRGSFFRY